MTLRPSAFSTIPPVHGALFPDAKPWSVGTSESPVCVCGASEDSLHLPFLALLSPIMGICPV